jgi:hypothetical protein
MIYFTLCSCRQKMMMKKVREGKRCVGPERRMVESVVHRNTRRLICDELEDNMCVARRKSSRVSKRTNFYGRSTTSPERLTTNDHKVSTQQQTLLYSQSIQFNSMLVKRPHDSATYREVLSNEYNRSMHAPTFTVEDKVCRCMMCVWSLHVCVLCVCLFIYRCHLSLPSITHTRCPPPVSL